MKTMSSKRTQKNKTKKTKEQTKNMCKQSQCQNMFDQKVKTKGLKAYPISYCGATYIQVTDRDKTICDDEVATTVSVHDQNGSVHVDNATTVTIKNADVVNISGDVNKVIVNGKVIILDNVMKVTSQVTVSQRV